jgi:hypothetical protein
VRKFWLIFCFVNSPCWTNVARGKSGVFLLPHSTLCVIICATLFTYLRLCELWTLPRGFAATFLIKIDIEFRFRVWKKFYHSVESSRECVWVGRENNERSQSINLLEHHRWRRWSANRLIMEDDETYGNDKAIESMSNKLVPRSPLVRNSPSSRVEHINWIIARLFVTLIVYI